MVEESKSHFTKCECHGHLLEVERYNEGNSDEGFNFTIWEQGLNIPALTWREKFRWCWRILTSGKPWADHIVATNKHACEIANFILENLPSNVQTTK